MYSCPKCRHDIEFVESPICPHCKLIFYDDTHTTWIGSSLDCDILFDHEDIPPYAAAITYNERNNEFELVNLVGEGFAIYKNRKRVDTKTSISIDDKIKIENIVFDCNHPKINQIFLTKNKASISISYDNFEMFSVGSAPECDIILNDLPGEKVYGSIIKSQDSYFCYQPQIGSGASIFIDDYKLIQDELSLIDENDNIFIDDVKLPVYKIPGFINPESPFFNKQRFPLTFEYDGRLNKSITIGHSNCDIVLQSEKISYHHLTINQIDDDHFMIKDNDSFTGVYIGEKKIKEAVVGLGQVVIFGNHQLKIVKRGDYYIIWIDQLKGKIRIDALNVCRKVKRQSFLPGKKSQKILNDISISIGAGEFIGIMGPSGSGKTTFLKILAGVDNINHKDICGDLYYNFTKIEKDDNLFHNEVSYLPQDDILFPDLTVYQCLYYSAKLKMPHLRKVDINELVDKVIDNLNLDAAAEDDPTRSIKHRKIGSVNKPGAISGGQRKRINLAVELLSNPSILFLDEPSSGLSSIDSEYLMDLLVHINNMGNTIITTIHQPSKEVFRKFDKIIVLAPDGNLAYFGSPTQAQEFFEEKTGLKFDLKTNPANFILKALGTRIYTEWKQVYKDSDAYEYHIQRHVRRFQSKIEDKSQNKIRVTDVKYDNISQFWTLVARNFKLKLNNLGTLSLLLLQAPVIALLVGIIFSSPLFDGTSLEISDRPIDDSKRIRYYTQLSTFKENFSYLPPYKRFYVSFLNQTDDSLYLYSRVIDTSRRGGGWSFFKFGDYDFSMARIKNNNRHAESFPIEKGNYRFVISDDSITKPRTLLRLFNLKNRRDKERNSYYLDSSKMVTNWYELSIPEKKRLWRENILAERAKHFEDPEFNNYKVIDTNSIFAFANLMFDEYPILDNVKKYYYAKDNNKYGWYDINFEKDELFTSDKEYKSKSLTNLYLFFVVVISFIWIGLTNSVKDIVLERPVFIRERFTHLNLFTYVSSKFFTLFIVSLVQITMFLSILLAFIPNLPINTGHLFMIMLLTTLISVGIGLILSSFSNHIEFAISLLPIILIPQLLLAGVFKHIGAMSGFLKTLSAFMISRWSVESSVNAISRKIDFESPFLDVILPFRNIIYPCYTSTVENGKVVTHGYFPYPLELDYIVMGLFLGAVFWASIVILKMKDK